MTDMAAAAPRGRLVPLLPALICTAVFIAALSSLLVDSLVSGGTWSLQHYRRFVSDPVYFAYLLRSIRVGVFTTIGAIVVGYAMAYWMAHGSALVRRTLLLLTIFQFFTVTITKVYAILLVLGNNGLINRALIALGLRDTPLPLVNNELGVVIGLIAASLPFAVLPIFSTMMGMRMSLIEAAATLGANRMIVFRRIILPLSMPGVVAGAVLVFLYSLGGLITPALIGGGFVDLIASFSYEQALLLSNPGFAAAGAVVTLSAAFLMVLGLELVHRRLRREP
ncbi:MAG: ABC transporter permease [Alphaproteobacteria bacterium]|nr:ABC transporter permease [Alphaproteobacteria bacterium]